MAGQGPALLKAGHLCCGPILGEFLQRPCIRARDIPEAVQEAHLETMLETVPKP